MLVSQLLANSSLTDLHAVIKYIRSFTLVAFAGHMAFATVVVFAAVVALLHLSSVMCCSTAETGE